MQLVRQTTSIPVPKIYSAFIHKGRTYILMERIVGHNLAVGWAGRSKQSKKNILDQLRLFVEELRKVSPPDHFSVANVEGGPIYDPRLPKTSFWGPFKTIDDFHLELRNGIGENHTNQDMLPGIPELISFHNQADDYSVLTHGDLSSLNILSRGDEVVGIVDWETAGWLPPYWEYVSAWNVNPQNSFWQEEVDKFLAPYPYALEMECVRRKYFGDF